MLQLRARLAFRILAAVGIGVVATNGVGMVATIRMGELRSASERLYAEGLVRKSALDTVTARMYEARAYMNRVVIDDNPGDVAKREQVITGINKALDDALAAYLNSYDGGLPAATRAAYDELVAANAHLRQVYTDELLPPARRNDDVAAKVVIDGDLATARNTLVAVLGNLNTIEDANNMALKKSAEATYRSAVATMVTANIIATAASVAIGLLVARSVVRPVRHVRDVLARVAAGDLRARCTVRSGGEVGDMAAALNTTLERTQRAIVGINDVAAQLSSSSEELAAASQQVSGNVSVIAATTEELHASVDHIARSAEDVSQVANEAVGLGNSATDLVGRLSQSSQDIGGVIDLIAGIAKQTNLLALNATIEAARAGATGRGFAVVASEVKDLAQASSAATDSIRSQIETIQADAERANGAIGSIGRVIEHIQQSQEIVAQAVEEQASATAEMSLQLGQIAVVSSALASGSAATGPQTASATDLADLAGQLKLLVQHFQA